MGNLFSFPWTRREDLFEGLPPDAQGVVWGYAEATFRAENSWAGISRMEVVADLTVIQEIIADATDHDNDIRYTPLYDRVREVMWDFERYLDETPAHVFTRLEVLKARLTRMTLERNYDPELTRWRRLDDMWGTGDEGGGGITHFYGDSPRADDAPEPNLFWPEWDQLEE
jgi:hypothetical protein